ncbi:hypothetical protein CRN79_03450 [Serratia fonticola]|uniref:TolC family protein n=1 Tax=Serratia fonticola TaxID=47917 RepID=UPI000BFD89A4|nr:TolC family protein [Serratia fonticola]ATM74958.1 hypothetical protein CRN79_03450 [Serratia fonticola]
MKNKIFRCVSKIEKCKIAFFLLITLPCVKANATEFIDIIRMTADHPSIQSAIASTDAAFFDIEQAKSANNIQVSAGLSSVGYSGQPGYENNLISPHIGFSKTLYDHGRTDAAVHGKEAAYRMQQAQVKVIRETLNQQALSLFTTSLLNAKIVNVLDQEILALKDLLERVKAIASIDPGRASEINQVATRLSSVIASREMSNTSQQQAWKELSTLLRKDISLNSELPDLKKLGLLPVSLDMAESALRENPSWIVANYKRDEATAAVNLASKWNRPTWNVQLKLDSPRHNGEMEPFKAATLQVSSDMNLWDGGSGAATLNGETKRLVAAEQDLDTTIIKLKQQLEQLWISLPLREAQINALAQQSESALKTWKAGEIQFFSGQRPLTDLISFATDYYSSLASFEEQKVQYIATQWQIVSALGKMSELAKNVNSLPAPSIKTSGKAHSFAFSESDKNSPLMREGVKNNFSVSAKDNAVEAFKSSVGKSYKLQSDKVMEQSQSAKDENTVLLGSKTNERFERGNSTEHASFFNKQKEITPQEHTSLSEGNKSVAILGAENSHPKLNSSLSNKGGAESMTLDEKTALLSEIIATQEQEDTSLKDLLRVAVN